MPATFYPVSWTCMNVVLVPTLQIYMNNYFPTQLCPPPSNKHSFIWYLKQKTFTAFLLKEFEQENVLHLESKRTKEKMSNSNAWSTDTIFQFQAFNKCQQIQANIEVTMTIELSYIIGCLTKVNILGHLILNWNATACLLHFVFD